MRTVSLRKFWVNFVFTKFISHSFDSWYIGNLSGIISERDYVKKVALLGRVSKETKVKDIFTQKRNLVKASPDDSVEEAMNKMMTKSIRHLPIVDGEKLVGIVSIKDLIKAVVEDRNKQIKDLSEIALGKSSY